MLAATFLGFPGYMESLTLAKNNTLTLKTFFKMSCFVLFFQPTLYNNLVARHQYLLTIWRLSVLQDGGALLDCARVGHGDRRDTLDAFRPRVRQVDFAIRGYGD